MLNDFIILMNWFSRNKGMSHYSEMCYTIPREACIIHTLRSQAALSSQTWFSTPTFLTYSGKINLPFICKTVKVTGNSLYQNKRYLNPWK